MRFGGGGGLDCGPLWSHFPRVEEVPRCFLVGDEHVARRRERSSGKVSLVEAKRRLRTGGVRGLRSEEFRGREGRRQRRRPRRDRTAALIRVLSLVRRNCISSWLAAGPGGGGYSRRRRRAKPKFRSVVFFGANWIEQTPSWTNQGCAPPAAQNGGPKATSTMSGN